MIRWNGFSIEVRSLRSLLAIQTTDTSSQQRGHFPELVPGTVSGNYSTIASGRVLNAKQSTKARSFQKSRAVWDRVAQKASSSSAPSASTSTLNNFPALERFPVLQTPSSSGPVRPPSQGQRTTHWIHYGHRLQQYSSPCRGESTARLCKLSTSSPDEELVASTRAEEATSAATSLLKSSASSSSASGSGRNAFPTAKVQLVPNPLRARTKNSLHQPRLALFGLPPPLLPPPRPDGYYTLDLLHSTRYAGAGVGVKAPMWSL